MKKCMNCGTENVDHAGFCASCGASLENAPIVKKDNNKNIGIAAVGAVALILIILVCSLFGGGYKKVAKTYLSGMCNLDAKKVSQSMSKDIYKAEETTQQEFIDELNTYFAFVKAYDKNIKMSYKIKKYNKMDKSEIKEVNEKFKDKYDKKLKVSAGYKVDVTVTTKLKDEKETESLSFKVIKVNGKWSIHPSDMEDSLF